MIEAQGHSAASTAASSARPRSMSTVTVAIGILNLTALTDVKRIQHALLAMTVVLGVSYLLLWFFWKGRNWARWCWLIMSVIAVIDLFELFHPRGNIFIYDSTVISWAAMGFYLLYWLNRPDMRDWFRAQKK